MKLLIVEDDDGVFVAIRATLRGMDVEIHRVPTWSAMLEELGTTTYNVIILDLGLPDSDTLTTLASIRNLKMNYPATAICVITGQPNQNMETAKAAGADDFIHKSDVLMPRTLISRLTMLFHRGQNNSEKYMDAQVELARKMTDATIAEFKKQE